MVIDFHTHTFPDAIAASTLKKLSGVSHSAPFTDGTGAGLAASMAEAGVDLSVVLPVATSPRQVRHINEAAALANRRTAETGLFSFGCIHPDCENWREELDRIAALGLKGVKLHPVYQGVDLDDPRYLRILTRAGELGLVAVTHAGVDIGYPDAANCLPRVLLRAVRQAGPVKLVAAHMGGWKRWEEALELLADTSVYLDTSFSTGFIAPLDDGYYTPEQLRLLDGEGFVRMVRGFGAERILFGTDSPWSGQRESVEWLRALPLAEGEKAAILGGNARRLLDVTD